MIRNYLLVAWKVLLRRKFFTFISLFGICFTLMVLMVATALLDHTFAPHAPESKLDRALEVLRVTLHSPERNSVTTSGISYDFFNRYIRTLPDVEDVSLFSGMESISIFSRGKSVDLFLKQTDGAFWRIFNFTFLEGRPFTEEEERNGLPVAVITGAVRKELFGNSSAIGRTINTEGKIFRIVGVVAPVPILRLTSYADVWVPIRAANPVHDDNSLTGAFNAVILARSSNDLDRIRNDYQEQLQRVEFPDPTRYNTIESRAATIAEHTAIEIARELFGIENPDNAMESVVLWGGAAVFVFMLLPAVNLVNINVSRIMERASEIGVRKSFGASSGTLVGQFLVENLFLVTIGGLLGLLMSWLVLQYIAAAELIPHADFRLNYRIFLCAFFITIFFGVFSGVYPAWKMSRLHPITALKGGTRS